MGKKTVHDFQRNCCGDVLALTKTASLIKWHGRTAAYLWPAPVAVLLPTRHHLCISAFMANLSGSRHLVAEELPTTLASKIAFCLEAVGQTLKIFNSF